MAFHGEIFEIMSWLPAKPLHKFLTIAKPCKDFLSENFFMEKQCHNSCMKPEESLIIQDNSCLRYKAEKLKFSFSPEDGHYYNDIPKKSRDFLSTKGRILASCNGLILCRTVNPNDAITKLFLCNPVTKTWLPIELPNEDLAYKAKDRDNMIFTLVCGNLYGNKNKKFPYDYTILAFIKHIDGLEDWYNSGYDMYLLEQGEWLLKGENLPTGPNDLNLSDQVCCNNGVFFITEFGFCYRFFHRNYWPYVVHFDIDNGSSKILPLPEEARVKSNANNSNFRVLGWDSKEGNSWFESVCLVMYSDKIITIWVLEGESMDKKSSSWRKILSLNIINDFGFRDAKSWTNSFTILRKKMIFADKDGHIYCYYLDGRNFGKLEKIYKYEECLGISGLRFNAYSTTIRPCLKDSINLPLKM